MNSSHAYNRSTGANGKVKYSKGSFSFFLLVYIFIVNTDQLGETVEIPNDLWSRVPVGMGMEVRTIAFIADDLVVSERD